MLFSSLRFSRNSPQGIRKLLITTNLLFISWGRTVAALRIEQFTINKIPVDLDRFYTM
jgi:hypothetical protein